jgi:SAM-dependent methyltransferase
MAQGVDGLPAPREDLVFATQGHRDVASYRDSIVAGQFQLRFGLGEGVVAAGSARSVLDFGCGTGRLLAGWWADAPTTQLVGCDIARELIDWAGTNLPPAIRVFRTSLEPPLPFGDSQFDVILAVSVFTHLSLFRQRLWAKEFRRLLEPGGKLVVTTHGHPYVRLFASERLAEFERDGYLEIPSTEEGRNSFATFHGRRFAERLFSEFEPVAYLPSGGTSTGAALFPLASLQDVHVLRRAAFGAQAGR